MTWTVNGHIAKRSSLVANCLAELEIVWKRDGYAVRFINYRDEGGISLRALAKLRKTRVAKLRHEGEYWRVVVTPPHVNAKALAMKLLLQGL